MSEPISQEQIDSMAAALRRQGLTWSQTNFAISLVRNAVEAEQQAGEAVGEIKTITGTPGFPHAPYNAPVWADGMQPPPGTKLFTHPQQPLSDEQIKALRPLPFSNAELDRLYANIPPTAQQDARSREAFKRIARCVEAAHGITKDTK